MECPECGAKAGCLDSKAYAGAVYRKRKCSKCGFTFYSEELECENQSFCEEILRKCRSEHRLKKEREKRQLHTNCVRCGRKLKTVEAREIGLGTVCQKKVRSQKNARQLF